MTFPDLSQLQVPQLAPSQWALLIAVMFLNLCVVAFLLALALRIIWTIASPGLAFLALLLTPIGLALGAIGIVLWRVLIRLPIWIHEQISYRRDLRAFQRQAAQQPLPNPAEAPSTGHAVGS